MTFRRFQQSPVYVLAVMMCAMTGTVWAQSADGRALPLPGLADGGNVMAGANVSSVAVRDDRRTRWHQRDSLLDGMLIGAGIGAIPGVYWLLADPNECNGMCPEDYGLIAIGAGIGALIDAVIHAKTTVDAAEPPCGFATRVSIGPFAERDRKGVLVGVRF